MTLKHPVCIKCYGKGFYYYDEHHGKPCEYCCKHSDYFELKEHYGSNNGKMCCKDGCGKTITKEAYQDIKK